MRQDQLTREASDGSRLKERKAIYSIMQPVLIKKACSKEKTTITLTTCFTNDFALENRGKSDFKMLGTIFTMAQSEQKNE